jgi:hypothetical protein
MSCAPLSIANMLVGCSHDNNNKTFYYLDSLVLKNKLQLSFLLLFTHLEENNMNDLSSPYGNMVLNGSWPSSNNGRWYVGTLIDW